MATYPIHIPRDVSRAKRGERRRRLLNALAADLEEHINKDLTTKPPGTYEFLYGLLALDLGVPEEDVRSVMTRVPAGGHNGIRIRKEPPG